MPVYITQVYKILYSRHSREMQSPWSRIGLASALLASLLLVGVLLAAAGYYFILTRDLPAAGTLYLSLEPPMGSLLQPTRLYDRNQAHVLLTLQDPAAEAWQYLHVGGSGQAGSNQAPQSLVDATLAAFDPGFWNEPGYSLRGILAGTHPTLAQRLVAGLLLDERPASLKRNLQERLLAMQVTAQFGRQKVLEWFLNSARYGQFVYGADAAARVYLGKPAAQVSIAEAALLAAISASPDLDPWDNAQLLRDRQVQLIQQMQANHLVTAVQAEGALRENIQLQPRHTLQSVAPALTNLVLSQLSTQIPLSKIYRGGYKIITTLDYTLQSQVACASQLQLDRLAGLPDQMFAPDGSSCAAGSILPVFASNLVQSLGGVKGSAMVLDPQVGQILAWVGGEVVDTAPSSTVSHPATTVLSPFWYLAAFSRGMGPASLVWDLPVAQSLDISPAALAQYHGPVRLRTAMVNDYAGAAAQVVEQVGVDNILATEQKFGIPLMPGTASADPGLQDLYAQPVSLLDSLQAYGILANQGAMVGQRIQGQDGLHAAAILRVYTVAGTSVLDWSDASLQPIVTGPLAYLVTHVLSDPSVRSDSLVDVLDIGRPAAVKVGSVAGANNWTIGYIPQLVVGVWMDAERGVLPAEVPAGLWRTLMEVASSRLPALDFAVPAGITRVQVCDPSGLLVSAACPSAVDEVFLQGYEPVEVDDLYHLFSLDAETGLLATVFTPPERLQEKVYLVVPPEARQWAVAVGFPIPPDRYDEVASTQPASGDVYISQPQMQQSVRGKVQIFGRAGGQDFSYYRLEVGQGFNPTEWLQVGEDVHQPVEQGLLGTWDTSGLDGPYVLELLRVRQNHQFERSYLLLNIDNTPPKLQVLAPSAGSQLVAKAEAPVVLQAEASDDQALHSLEFYVDGLLVSTLLAPPYYTAWPAEPGTHALGIKAYDLAGNISTVESTFSIVP